MQDLWQHQQQAIDFVEQLGGRAMIAMEMGTGKTRTAIECLRRWQSKRVLILCPKSVVAVWPKEFEKYTTEPEKFRVLALDQGTCSKRAQQVTQALEFAEYYKWRLVVVLNYEAATEPAIANLLKTIPWDVLVADECHRLKDPTGKRSKFIARLADAIPKRLGLTGTPCPHSPLDLWAQFRMINRSVYGNSFHQFRWRYAVLGGFQDRQVVGYQNMPELTNKFHQHAFRVRTADVLELPPFVDIRRYTMLGSTARRSYDSFERDLIVDINNDLVTASNALVKLLRLSQFTSGFYTDDVLGQMHELGGEKKELLTEIITEVQQQKDQDTLHGTMTSPEPEPVVVFGRFHHDLDTIHQVASDLGLTSSELSGRVNELDRWQRGQTEVLAVQLQAGGLGVDLTRANVCIYYSLNYSLGDFMQTRARVHRPGQKRAVTYIHMLAANTIDDVVYTALERREEVVKAVVDRLRGSSSRGAKARAKARNSI